MEIGNEEEQAKSYSSTIKEKHRLGHTIRPTTRKTEELLTSERRFLTRDMGVQAEEDLQMVQKEGHERHSQTTHMEEKPPGIPVWRENWVSEAIDDIRTRDRELQTREET